MSNYHIKYCFWPIFFAMSIFPWTKPIYAQGEKNILTPPDNSWNKEVFIFPISFAPSLPYSGVEEAWFPKTWSKKDSAGFWSYAFVWSIKAKSILTKKELEKSLQIYFDGLMAEDQSKNKVKTQTQVLTLQQIQENGKSFIKGKIIIYDGFTLHAPLKLYVSIEQVFLKEKQIGLILFRFSPKNYEHDIWQKLNSIQIL